MGYSFNGNTKVISLTAGTTQLSIRDLWSRWVDWLLVGDNSKYPIAFQQVGGNPIDVSVGTSIPVYVYLQNGWRIKPQESNHTLNIGDGILLVDGGGDPFINTVDAYTVRVNYSQPVQAITVNTGSVGIGLSDAQKIDEIHTILRLNPIVPVIADTDSITAGSIQIQITGDGETFSMAQRQ